jgi:hypothetical protein
MADTVKTVKIKTLREGITTPREGSRELDRHPLGAELTVPEAAAERLCRIGAAEKVTGRASKADKEADEKAAEKADEKVDDAK